MNRLSLPIRLSNTGVKDPSRVRSREPSRPNSSATSRRTSASGKGEDRISSGGGGSSQLRPKSAIVRGLAGGQMFTSPSRKQAATRPPPLVMVGISTTMHRGPASALPPGSSKKQDNEPHDSSPNSPQQSDDIQRKSRGLRSHRQSLSYFGGQQRGAAENGTLNIRLSVPQAADGAVESAAKIPLLSEGH